MRMKLLGVESTKTLVWRREAKYQETLKIRTIFLYLEFFQKIKKKLLNFLKTKPFNFWKIKRWIFEIMTVWIFEKLTVGFKSPLIFLKNTVGF